MNQYQQQNAIRLIDGYYIPAAQDTPSETFEQAKAETIINLQKTIETLQDITEEQFNAGR